jgi:toxin HigB-1
MILSFRCAETERIFRGRMSVRFPPAIQPAARRKLYYLDAAMTLSDLRVPPGNRLEKLQGARSGQHSIRVNDQWRICFVWRSGGAYDVELVDYH